VRLSSAWPLTVHEGVRRDVAFVVVEGCALFGGDEVSVVRCRSRQQPGFGLAVPRGARRLVRVRVVVRVLPLPVDVVP